MSAPLRKKARTTNPIQRENAEQLGVLGSVMSKKDRALVNVAALLVFVPESSRKVKEKKVVTVSWRLT